MAIYKKGNFTIVPNMHLSNQMSAQAFRVYAVICKYADENGLCFPSRMTIARACAFQKSKSVDPYIAELIEIGVIKKTIQRGEKGVNKTNLYQVQIVEEQRGVAPEQGLGVAPSEGLGSPQLGTRGSPQLGAQNYTNSNYTNEYRKVSEELFNFWNEKAVVIHKKLTDDVVSEIRKLLQKGYTKESIQETITLYATIYHDPAYFWTYKWNFHDFLKRGVKSLEGKKKEDYKKADAIAGPAVVRV